MAPEMDAKAIDAYVAESNRPNYERRASFAADIAEVTRVGKYR